MASPDQMLDNSPSVDVSVVPRRRMTEEEFVAWCDDKTRAEWVEGEVIIMSPVGKEHADLNLWLSSLLLMFVQHHDVGTVIGPEFMIRLADGRSRRVPDILFVADERRDVLRRTHVEGAPDLAVEIVSPDSGARDWREKYLEYEAAGVREYWVIDPVSQHVEVYALADDGKYRRVEEKQGAIESAVLAGFHLKVAWLWPDTRPKVLDAARELGVA